MKLPVPKELVLSCEELASRWFATHTLRSPIPIDCCEEPEQPASRVRCRKTMPALIHYREQQASEYPETISATALSVLGVTGCKYAHGEPGEEGFYFCNKPCGHHSYCAEHHALVYVEPSSRRM